MTTAISIDVTDVLGHVNRPLVDTWTLSGNAAAFSIIGVPRTVAGIAVTSVALQITNADGTTLTIIATQGDAAYYCIFPASHFASYGTVDGGVRVYACGTGANGASVDLILATGNLCIRKGDPAALPGELANGVWYRGEDVFNKAGAPDAYGVQHYKKQVLEYDAEMGAWGVSWVGDYIIVNGQFVEVEQ